MSKVEAVPLTAKPRYPSAEGFLHGGGEMARRIQAFDWSKTSLGALRDWPQSLRTAVSIILQAPVRMVLLWGTDGIMIYNDAYAQFAGVKHPQLLGSKVVEGWPEIADFNRNVVEKGLKGETLLYKDQRLTLYRSNTAEEVWMDLSYSPVLDENGVPAGVLAIIVEITQQVEARRQAEESETHFRFMAETLPLKIFTASAEGRVTYFNPQWEEYTGIPMKELHKNGVQQLLHPDDLAGSMNMWREAIKDGRPLQNEQRLRRADGQYRRHVSYARAMRDSLGNILSWFGSMTDIEDILQTAIKTEKLELMAAGLKEQRAQLMAISNAKDEFIALASHQLRTPATAVKQYLGMVLDGFFGPVSAEQHRNLQTAYDSNERQLNIINDLLKTAQIDSTPYMLHKKPQAISKIVDEAIKELQPALQLKHQNLVFEGRDTPTKALVDSNEMKLVFVNLLENASKYSYPDTTIVVRLTRNANHVEVEVRDSGVGLSSQNAKRIFDKFTRIDNELSDTVTGSGLGLYWVKKIVKLHHGTIRVKSTLGKGSTFIVRLPL